MLFKQFLTKLISYYSLQLQMENLNYFLMMISFYFKKKFLSEFKGYKTF